MSNGYVGGVFGAAVILPEDSSFMHHYLQFLSLLGVVCLFYITSMLLAKVSP
jgi:hypothetical protein